MSNRQYDAIRNGMSYAVTIAALIGIVAIIIL